MSAGRPGRSSWTWPEGHGVILREPRNAVEVALARDEAGDRTQERNRSGAVDALRAIAALMILLDHTSYLAVGTTLGPVPTAITRMLAGGIYLFFVVSGYLIAGPFLRALVRGDPLPALKPYLVRRGARILPGYWVAFTVFLLLFAHSQGVRPYQLPVHFLLLQTLWPRVGEAEAIYGVAWTLGIEATFYVLVPLVAMALRAVHRGPWRPGRLAVLVAISGAACIVWTYFVRREFGVSAPSIWAQIAQHGPQMWWYAFCPGMLVALLALADERHRLARGVRRLMATPALCLGAAVALWPLAFAMERSGSYLLVTLSPPVYVVACGLILGTTVVAGNWIDRPVRVLAPIGLVSYGIYLWHWTVIQVIWRDTSWKIHGVGLAWLADASLVLAFTLPLAAASWFAIERPSMRWAAGWAKRHRRSPEAVGGAEPDGPKPEPAPPPQLPQAPVA